MQARADDGKKEEKREGRYRTSSKGARVIRAVCEGCGMRAVEWMVDGEGLFEGCHWEGRKRLCRRRMEWVRTKRKTEL